MSFHTYLGPYVRCLYKPRTREKTFPACVNLEGCNAAGIELEHGRPRLAKFCHLCGGPIGKGSRQVPDRPDFSDVVGDDVFIDLDPDSEPTAGVLYLGSNLVKGYKDREMCLFGEVHLDVSAMYDAASGGATVWDEIEWFKKEYAAALDQLRVAYDDVGVLWGLHTYWH